MAPKTTIVLALVAALACTCNGFVAPVMSAQGASSRQVFVKQSLAAGAAVLGGVAAASALPEGSPLEQVTKPLSDVSKQAASVLPDDPDKLPDEFAKNGPGLIQGKPLSPKNRGIAKKLEFKAEDNIAERNKTQPQSGNADVARRIEKGIDNASSKPLTL
ncbi:hypothetical protein JKP88DRAFT_14021 [Tribonema minus]|uniref:Uncharacterized protein n=1 Tax=Tribonema minus TaxID=303371 RepID=A0A836CMH2_9STRA|nr:hypothetical protein JKP88DRAFT_14021 [Tribonema minus]